MWLCLNCQLHDDFYVLDHGFPHARVRAVCHAEETTIRYLERDTSSAAARRTRTSQRKSSISSGDPTAMIRTREWASFPFFLTSHAKLLCFVDRLRVSASFKLHPSSFCKQVLYLHLLTGYFPNKIPSLHLPSEAGEGQGGPLSATLSLWGQPRLEMIEMVSTIFKGRLEDIARQQLKIPRSSISKYTTENKTSLSPSMTKVSLKLGRTTSIVVDCLDKVYFRHPPPHFFACPLRSV